MLKKALKTMLKKMGYDIRTTDKAIQQNKLYQLYHYKHDDGSFDYQTYRDVQIRGNKRKLSAVWVIEENIQFLSSYIKEYLGPVEFGICHGTRNGKEQAWFRKYLNCDVLGTEISDTAHQFEYTIQWDFHEIKPEWVDKADFIYSNSFDHSYDPEKCLNAWIKCLKPGGLCILEHNSSSDNARELDPFGAPIETMPYLILNWGKGDFWVREILNTPTAREYLQYSSFLVIEKKKKS